MSTRRRRVGLTVQLISAVVCFGAVGLLWFLVRRRRSGVRGRAGRRRRTWLQIFVGSFVILQAVGAGATAYRAVEPPLLCHAHLFPDGRVQTEPHLQDVSPPRTWRIARDVVNAPTTGLGLLVSSAAGMRECAGPPLTVTFWEPPRLSGGGSTIGSTFVAWMPADYDSSSILPGAHGFAAATDRRELDAPYVRYGPNISETRANELELARHESRHTDQWAVLTLIGGPLAFPLAYYTDSAFFPGSRNHFERAAGLADGNYRPPPDDKPAPLPGAVAVTGAVLGLVLRRRIRWLWRILATDGTPPRRPTRSVPALRTERDTDGTGTSHLGLHLDKRAPQPRTDACSACA
jgi:hypothetical protein